MMNRDTDKITPETLTEDIQEQNDFIKLGFERIIKYYTLSSDKRDKETDFSTPPHELILQRSTNIIKLGLSKSFDSDRVNEVLQENSEIELSKTMDFDYFDYILIGVGTEILLKAIFLKEQPDIFITKTESSNNKFTPGFYVCKKWLIAHLKNKMPAKYLKRIEKVLELIQLKRNNLAHLSFHNMSNYREDYQVANVLRFLLLYFFKNTSSEIVIKLNQVKKETKVTSGIDYESVEFDEYI